VYFATAFVNDYEPLISGQPKELDAAFMKELDARLLDLADELFLDNVFIGNIPLLTRQEWEKNVLTGVKWMFDST
jgi:hypothetical protein